MKVTDATIIWNALRGLICVYKPANKSCRQIRSVIMDKIASDLNEMHTPPPSNYVAFTESPEDPSKYRVTVRPSYSEHPLVIGPYYQPDDLRCNWACHLGPHTSGVFLLGLRNGTKLAKDIRENKSIRCYHINGRFGSATVTGMKDDKVIARSMWRRVRQSSLESLLCNMQAAHQKTMFKASGVDIESQAAYELAALGPIRPADRTTPVIFGMKCIYFKPPNFTLELQCVNENEDYLISLVQDIGYQLRCFAHCTGILCIRDGHFTLEHALLMKHWQLQHFVDNLQECSRIIDAHEDMLMQTTAALH